GVVARTLGRLPFSDSTLSIELSRVILEMAEQPVTVGAGNSRPVGTVNAAAAQGVAHGLYDLARTRRVTGALPSEVIAWLERAAQFQGEMSTGAAPSIEGGARVRRLALLALAASGDTSTDVAQRAARDVDEQVRRLALAQLPNVRDTSVRRSLVEGALRDPSWLVRLEGVRSYRQLGKGGSCTPLLSAVGDAVPHVAIAAIDAMATGCDEAARVTDTLLSITDSRNPQHATRGRGSAGWQPYAHALVALARVAPTRVAPLVRRDVSHPIWQVRMYVARAAAIARDTATLSALASDANGDVREAALIGLSATVGHGADRLYLAALASPDYQVVRQGADALKGSPLGESVATAALMALDRISAEKRENSRDPRIALVERIGEFGSTKTSSRFESYAADFDSTIAQQSARILERWMLRRVAPAPKLLPAAPNVVGAVVGAAFRMTVKMSPTTGGGSFVVRLFTDDAPATVARIVRLAREGYYNGLTFHRVEPAFVIQGGSPKATEFVGDGPFMRDEVGLVSHTRGTLGISTRGRDTGDAQLFVNLTDNFRLDHDYTVFGEIVAGRDVAEGVLEGDVIERIDVTRVR
ncbi:MAG: peptidylprolyl isomerase, partial [Gemmatimonadaceae bacterium]